jgi:galactokinase
VLAALRAEFEARFGQPPTLAVRAPGRVNLIGEHTDYNEGLVLPCAIDRDTRVVAALREGGRVRVLAADLAAVADFDPAAPARRGDWTDYVQGPFAALAERGLRCGGLDLAVASEVPRESGLSSSAALCVAVTLACERVFGLGLSAEDVARVAHRAESGFVGVACGIMDPYASALGRRDHALRIDCRSGEVTAVPLAGGRLRLLIAHSGVRRALAHGGYGERVAECEAALAAARAAGIAPEARALRDLSEKHLPALERALEPRLFRRARHVVTENARVDAFCAALAREDLASGGALLREGQRSLRDDYEVSVPELDALCEIGDALPGVFGSRLTGAGFGGCTLHLVEPERAEAVAEALARGFETRFGRRAPVLLARPAAGAGDLALAA